MQNNTNDRVTPLKARGIKADSNPEDSESMEAATAPSRPKSGLTRALGFRPLWAALILAAVLLLILIYYRSTPLEIQNVPQMMAQKLETLSTLRINFLKSIEAEKLAVMAETDEASLAYADESKRAADTVGADLKELSRLIGMHPAADESKLLQEFEAAWEQVRKIDRVILDLAVQNTNLKAFRLSFGKGREAVERFENALNTLTRDVTDALLIRAAADALSAELKILTLHAPHIVSSDDNEMNQIEQFIHVKEGAVHRSLEILPRLAHADKLRYVEDAMAADREFRAVTATVMEWSRQNTNVNSLNISLDRKQKATALCETVLNQLHEAFKRQAFKATR
jgi:Four helix bundle sensory module for signal transduction